MRTFTNEDTTPSVKHLQVVMDGHNPKLGFFDENKKLVVLASFACEKAASFLVGCFRNAGGIITEGDYADE